MGGINKRIWKRKERIQRKSFQKVSCYEEKNNNVKKQKETTKNNGKQKQNENKKTFNNFIFAQV